MTKELCNLKLHRLEIYRGAQRIELIFIEKEKIEKEIILNLPDSGKQPFHNFGLVVYKN